MPLGAEKAGMMGAAGGATGNYFGDGSDGAVVTGGTSQTYTPPNISGSDADMVVKNFSSLTLTSGDSISVNARCRGMLLYVKGDCTIAGTISMSQLGGNSNPTIAGGSDSAVVNASGLQLPMFTASGVETLAAATFAGAGDGAVSAVGNQPAIDGDGTIYSILRTQSNGAPGITSRRGGAAGGAGTTGAKAICTAGGATGGTTADGPETSCSAGAGGNGGCFSGGSGSGAGSGQTNRHSNPANPYGGGASGGVCGGSGWQGCQAGPGATEPGGLIWLVVGGDLTFTGAMNSSGKNGYNASTVGNGGGGSGGGAIMILYAGTLSDSGSISLGGGSGGSGAHTSPGGTGGTGGQFKSQVSEA